MKLTPEERQTVSDIRHRIAQSKSHNTWRGFIDWKGCIQVCDELADILEDARKYMEDGQYLLAYTITGVVLINAARLASSADDSYGGVTFVKNRVDNLLDEICTSSEVVLNPELADAILSKSCKDALNKGKNTIRIEVTNLPANRIAELDRQGVKWRKMKEINVVDIDYKKTTYEKWTPVASGLNSSVKLVELKD